MAWAGDRFMAVSLSLVLRPALQLPDQDTPWYFIIGNPNATVICRRLSGSIRAAANSLTGC